MGLRVEITDYPLLDSGEMYPGKLLGITVKDGRYGPSYQFIIELDELDSKGEKLQINGLCGTDCKPGNKLFRWAIALGMNVESMKVGASFDLESLVGNGCRIQIGISEGKGNAKYNNIKDIFSEKKGTSEGSLGAASETSADSSEPPADEISF